MKDDERFRILKLIDHDKQFELSQNRSGIEPVILNKLDLSSADYVEQLQSHIYADGSFVDLVARCECGETEGNNKTGMLCPICETVVTKNHFFDDQHHVAKNWLSCPTALVHGWLAPKIYLSLSAWLTYGNKSRSYLDDILDVDTEIPFELREVVQGKGFTYLYENFDRIMQYFFYNHPVISKKPDTKAMQLCLALNREKIFCRYVPILNAAINPIISDNKSGQDRPKYTDVTADRILAAAISLSRLEFSPKNKNKMLYAERTAYKAHRDITEYFKDATRKYMSVKKAIPRMHIFGSRFHWSFRGVIVPIIGDHDVDELHWPWKLAVNTLRVHIRGALIRKYGLSINEAAVKHRRALQQFDPEIYDIMNTLIKESVYKGIACVWHRPPSIRDGSVMLKFCTKIKPDISDPCIGVSVIDAALPNLDFDGDNLAGIVLLESEMVAAFRNMTPSALVWDRDTGGVTNEIGLNKTLAVTWNRYLQN